MKEKELPSDVLCCCLYELALGWRRSERKAANRWMRCNKNTKFCNHTKYQCYSGLVKLKYMKVWYEILSTVMPYKLIIKVHIARGVSLANLPT